MIYEKFKYAVKTEEETSWEFKVETFPEIWGGQ